MIVYLMIETPEKQEIPAPTFILCKVGRHYGEKPWSAQNAKGAAASIRKIETLKKSLLHYTSREEGVHAGWNRQTETNFNQTLLICISPILKYFDDWEIFFSFCKSF